MPAIESGYLPSPFNTDGNLDASKRSTRRQYLTSISTFFAKLRLGFIVDAAFHSRKVRSDFYRILLQANPNIFILLLYVHCDDPEVRNYRRTKRNSQVLNTEKGAISREEEELSLRRYEIPDHETLPNNTPIPTIDVDTARMLVSWQSAQPSLLDDGHIASRVIVSVREALHTGFS